MIKKLRIYQISLIAVSMICIGLLAFMGITAIQKSMSLKLQFNSEPAVSCEFAIRQADSTGAYNPIFKNYEGTTISNGVSLTQNILRFTGGDYATATGTAIDLQYTNATTKCSAIKLTITGATVNEVAPYSIFIPQGNTALIENISSPAGGTIQFTMEYVAEITFNLSYAQVSSVNGLTLKSDTTYYAVYGTTPSATLTATQNHMNPPQRVEIPNGLGSYSNGIINFEPISQDVSITVANTSMQTYAVVKELTKADVSYATTPTYGANFTFTVTIDEDCMQVEVSYKIGSGNYVVLNNPTVNGKSYTYTIAGANITGVVTIKAVGSSGYTITFDANRGSGTMASATVSEGQSYTIPANTFTNSPHNFISWNTKADGSGTSYKVGTSVSNLASAGETFTLYAQWTCTATFELTTTSGAGKYLGFVITNDPGLTFNYSETPYFYSTSPGGTSTPTELKGVSPGEHPIYDKQSGTRLYYTETYYNTENTKFIPEPIEVNPGDYIFIFGDYWEYADKYWVYYNSSKVSSYSTEPNTATRKVGIFTYNGSYTIGIEYIMPKFDVLFKATTSQFTFGGGSND